LCKN